MPDRQGAVDLDLSIWEPNEASLDRAAALLARGELVGLPTETVYGLAANATDPVAVTKIFAVKGRPPTNPLIVHVADMDRLLGVVDWPLERTIRSQLEAVAGLWPGPLTVVLPKSAAIPDVVTAGRMTVAVRIPQHPVALAVLRRCSFPLAAPSANRSNYISPTRPEHVSRGLGSAVSLILDGGSCEYGIESTILALGGTGPRLLRPGSITLETLEERLGIPVWTSAEGASQGQRTPDGNEHALGGDDDHLAKSSGFGADQRLGAEAPGMMRRHYSPTTPVWILGLDPLPAIPARSGRFAFGPISAEEASRYAVVEILSPSGDLREVARNLFAALRRLDACGLELIIADACEDVGIGRAIMDRLRRAASPA